MSTAPEDSRVAIVDRLAVPNPSRSEATIQHGLLQHPLTSQRAHAIRAHLLERAGRADAARTDFLAAADLTSNDVELRYLRSKAHHSSA